MGVEFDPHGSAMANVVGKECNGYARSPNTGKEVRGDQLKTSWKCIQAMAEKMMVGVGAPWN